MKIEVGQIVRLDIGDRIRVYQVTGVYLGSIKEENVIGLKCLDKKPSPETIRRTDCELLVPECFIELVICQERKIRVPLDVEKRCTGLADKTEDIPTYKYFVWFDTIRHYFHEIDTKCTGSDWKPVPPIDCIPVKIGTIIHIYTNITTNRVYLCIGGRAMKDDNKLGLFCEEDFNNENYVRMTTLIAKV